MRYIFIIFLFLFIGCSNKTSLKFFKADKLYERGLEYTQVKQIINDFETKAIINVTYLNNSYPNKYNNDYHNFLVGIYIFNDSDDDSKKALFNPNYKLTLNKKTPDIIKKLDKGDFLHENIPLFNKHATYYLLSFKKGNNKPILVYEHNIFGKVTVSF